MAAGNGIGAFPHDAAPAINEILRRISFRAEVFYRGQLCDSWALDTSGAGHVSFHLVRYGECWLHMPGESAPIRLVSDDIVMFPHDSAHVIGSSRERPSVFGRRTFSREVPIGADNPGTALICGFLEVDCSARQLFLASLPEYWVVSGRPGGEKSLAGTLVDLLFSEASADGIGSRAILDRLADALLIYVIRDIAQSGIPVRGLLGALGDPGIKKAVLAISADLARHWTLDSLAGEAHMSRSVFADRFLRACGIPPIEFLGIWRMHMARRWLEQEKASVQDIAERCGYESGPAFSKAFKRIMGAGPGQFRKIGLARNRK
jgi:AraC-like DNA-binding protein